jgi:hypothetical protein
MSRDKQIEEMAVDLCLIDRCKHLPQEECNNTTCAHCEAEALYNAGYRKQSESFSRPHENDGEWISVEDRLPEPNKLVLCIWERGDGGGCYGFARYQRENVWYVSNEGMPRVTHWMPLPEPPKMKGGGE